MITRDYCWVGFQHFDLSFLISLLRAAFLPGFQSFSVTVRSTNVDLLGETDAADVELEGGGAAARSTTVLFVFDLAEPIPLHFAAAGNDSAGYEIQCPCSALFLAKPFRDTSEV